MPGEFDVYEGFIWARVWDWGNLFLVVGSSGRKRWERSTWDLLVIYRSSRLFDDHFLGFREP